LRTGGRGPAPAGSQQAPGARALGRLAGSIALIVASCAALAPAAAARRDAGAILAIYPPWWDQRRSLEAADAAGLAQPAAIPFAALVRSAEADTAARLRRSGALLLLSAEPSLCVEKGTSDDVLL